MPTRIELESIVDLAKSAGSPVINESAFPDAPRDSFWSSSVFAYYAGNGWNVNFGNGSTSLSSVSSSYYRVRCVR